MKIVIESGVTVYLNNFYIKTNEINIKYIDKIIKKISKKYNLDLDGYLKIIVHKDKNYGIIIEIERETIDYLDCFNIELESDIEIIDENFLYKIDDIFSIKDIRKYRIYNYESEIYLEILENTNIGPLIENSTVIYGEEIDKVKTKTKIIKPEVITCTQ